MARLLALYLCLAVPAMAAEQPRLTFICMMSKSTCYKNESSWAGWYIDTIGPLVEQHSEFKFDYQPLPAKRLYKYLHADGQRLTILPKNSQLDPNLIYSKRPAGYGQIALYSLTKIDQFQGLSHLPRSRIALHRGMSYNGIRAELDTLGDKVQLLLVNNNYNIYRLLEKDRVDYVLSYRLPGVTPTSSSHPRTVLQRIDFHFAISNNNPAAQATMDKLDLAVERVYSELNLNYYFPPQDQLYRRELKADQ